MGVARILSSGLLGLTALEFLLGTYTELYTSCLPGGARYVFESNPCPASSQDALQVHVALGALLVLLGLVLLAWSIRGRIPGLIGPAFGGLLGLLIAAAGGYEFLASGNPAYSLLMAIGFLMALGAYFQANFALRMLGRSSGSPTGWTPPPGTPPSTPVREV